MLLEGRVVLVSGVGPGMGRSIALACAREGADVVLGARTEENLEAVGVEVEGLGRRAAWRATDITDAGDREALVALALDEFGHLDGVVHNAFIQPPLERLEQASLDTWRQAFEVNLFAGVALTTACLDSLRESAHASVVFIGSMSARRIRSRFGVYAATKSALVTTAQTLAKELGRDGIRVNTVLPGYIWEQKLQWFLGQLAEQQGRTRDDVYEEVAAEAALGRIPTPDEVADPVVFLLSDLARIVTGQTLDANAGHWFA